MDGPEDYPVARKDKYHMISLTCGIQKRDTNELIYKTETVLQISKTNLMVTKGDREGRDKSGAWDEHTHTTIYKIDNQQGHTVYSTGNSTQYSVITFKRKESKKE